MDDSVRVALRVRPLVNSEKERGCQNIINVIPEQNQVQIRNTEKAFTFNYVFDPSTEQEEFYNSAIRKMINSLFKGYNVTILAYGQTGSGKTHSMGTNYGSDNSMGVIPRAVNDIFNIIETKNNDWIFKVTVSFMELYQEQLYDLLAFDKQRKDCMIDIREENKEIKIIGITEKEVKNSEAALELLVQGSDNRATGATAMNHQSSRSHAIFTLTIHQQQRDDLNNSTTAKFHLVDLAGSERSKKTQATGERFKEGVNINKGLLALGNVISQLGDGNTNTFVNYRDSKLTRLLQDSLGGNSITLMIACISPADYNLEETLSTLRYADRAKKIKNKPIINQDPKTAEINRLNKIINDLRLQMLGNGTAFSCPPEHTELIEKNNLLKKKCVQLAETLHNNINDILSMNERAEFAENSREKICNGLQKILEHLDNVIKENIEKSEDPKYNEWLELLKNIRCQIAELLDEEKKINSEILQMSLSSTSQVTKSYTSDKNVETDENDSFAEICYDDKHTEHTLRQAERNDEVQGINRALAIKEELILKLRNSAAHFASYTEEIQEMENEIKKLQAEKEELLKALDNAQINNASVKISESRRKKVQELEKKISELMKKCAEQNRALENKQKDSQQIKNLTAEILQMKQLRVKLVREMRKEAENFNQYKAQRERELYKLKNQDRKRQHEMVKMKIQHDNQQNVFKRKLEEAHVVNKRLKEALEMQKKSRQRREKATNSKEEIRNWLQHELNVLHSIADAECSVDKLIKDREVIVSQLKKLETEYSQNSTPEIEKQMTAWKEHLDLRNAQISDFQQKLLESEQDTKPNSRWQMIQSMGDAKTALSMLFKTSAENEKKYFNKCQDFNDLMEKYDQICMAKRQCELKLQVIEKKVALQSNNSSESEYIKKIEQELATYKEKLQSLEQKSFSRSSNSKRTHSVDLYEYVELEDSIMIGEEVDDTKKDPDWKEEPLNKRARTTINNNENSDLNKDKKEKRPSKKRSSNEIIKCACKSKCSTRLCSCKKNSEACSSNCSCNAEICQNKSITSRLYFDDIINKTPSLNSTENNSI
ncbi:chromosome-associated kinesin KIF4A [Chelonus insularis]|uniref:chromosome-associated kinesin KIF4A n=1 Tax=Chelonus insularis TaxID=460826 RepID=UPI00158DDA38|nr:chromosome-associated kinesin KIF4A [Chelonus insularis]